MVILRITSHLPFDFPQFKEDKILTENSTIFGLEEIKIFFF